MATKKKAPEREPEGEKSARAVRAAAAAAAAGAGLGKAGTPPAEGDSAEAKPKSRAARRAPARKEPPAAAEAGGSGAATGRGTTSGSPADVLQEIRALKAMIDPLLTTRVEPDAALEGAVDSLRRLLSELLERRLESVAAQVADIRREAAASAPAELVDRLDALLDSLGAVRFEAESMDFVDPLIHIVIQERADNGVPDGVILETVRPGFRSARGAVIGKAAVCVNRRS